MDTERRYLVFTLQGRRYALDLADVAEVADPPATWPIPTAPPYYAGAMDFHGCIVAVMDLAAYMGRPSCHESEKVVVLDQRVAALAFLVERVIRIVPSDQVQLLPAPDDRFALALVGLAEGEATLLDAAAIVGQAADDLENR